MAKVLNASQLERGKKYAFIDKENSYLICGQHEKFFTLFFQQNEKVVVVPNYKLSFNEITDSGFVEVP